MREREVGPELSFRQSPLRKEKVRLGVSFRSLIFGDCELICSGSLDEFRLNRIMGRDGQCTLAEFASSQAGLPLARNQSEFAVFDGCPIVDIKPDPVISGEGPGTGPVEIGAGFDC